MDLASRALTAPFWALGLCLTVILVFLPDSSRAENWPSWRGLRGDGTSREKQVPLHWDGASGKNIRWRTPVPGEGHGSPIVWQDRIFLLSCLMEKQQRIIVCLDGARGKLLWQKTVLNSPLESKHALNSHASATPVTDGKLVYVAFLQVSDEMVAARNVSTSRLITPGSIVVAAYDFQGNRKWRANVGEFVSAHGFCSNPILYENLVIINGDHDGDSYVTAVDKQTGDTVWKIARRHKTRSYVTPIIRQIDGRTQMVFSGSKSVVSLDPRDGSSHWRVEGPTEQFVASMVYDGNLFFLTAGYPTHHVMGIRPDGRGDVTKTHVAWHVTKAKAYVPSPVVVGKYLLVADDRGTANCFDTTTGERLWQERMGKGYSASLVTADGLVYFLADDGVTKVVRPAATLDVVAQNRLGEGCYASPAISGGRMFLRGEKNLYCISRPQANDEREIKAAP